MLPNVVALAIPFFVLAVVLEVMVMRRSDKPYDLRDAATSLIMGIGNQLVSIAIGAAVVVFFFKLTYQYRLIEEIPINIWTILICLILDDFCYYWFHRISHERRWFWASHVVHHSSKCYNLTTALRQTWTGKISFTFIFSLPLMVIGFSPELVIFVGGVNLVYQFWIHTELVDKAGPLELIFNTPSHHRVHHATNPRYLDANYAGILIIWDKLFGTFVAERKDDAPRYGIIKNIQTFNPLKVAFHEWLAMAKDIAAAKSTKEIFSYLFAEPGWSPDGSRKTSKQLKQEWRNQQSSSDAN